MKGLRIAGIILVVVGILDFALFYLADLDLTGVWWSPYVFGTIGGIMMKDGKKKEEE